MAFDNERALQKIELFFDNSIKKSKMVLKEATKNLADEIVDITPIFIIGLDGTGSTKGNWRFATGSPDTSYDDDMTDTTGSSTKSTIRGQIQSTKITDSSVLYLTNSSPAIFPLEYGWYPTNPTYGSWNPFTQRYEIRSQGGFSKQAPAGIVGVSALRWQEHVADAKAKYAGPATG